MKKNMFWKLLRGICVVAGLVLCAAQGFALELPSGIAFSGGKVVDLYYPASITPEPYNGREDILRDGSVIASIGFTNGSYSPEWKFSDTVSVGVHHYTRQLYKYEDSGEWTFIGEYTIGNVDTSVYHGALYNDGVFPREDFAFSSALSPYTIAEMQICQGDITIPSQTEVKYFTGYSYNGKIITPKLQVLGDKASITAEYVTFTSGRLLFSDTVHSEFTNCTFNKMYVEMKNCSVFNFIGNTMTESSIGGSGSFSYNLFEQNKLAPLVISATDGAQCINNIFRNNIYSQIQLSKGYAYMHENLIDNNVTAPEAERSVEIVIWGNRNIVKRNVCAKSNWLGAMVVGGSDNQIFDNVFMNNTSDYSLVITGDRNIVKNNSIQGDETPGVYLSGNENEFFTNMVIVNNYSVLDQTGNNNEIYDNVFKNLLKGFPVGGFGGTGNIWNKDKLPGPNILGGPKIGGNYWLTYTGIDADGDGFGDTPYEITLNGANIDHLPLAPNVTGPLVVNTDGDQSDPDLADSLPDVDLIKPGMQTTLRAAIENANIRPAGGIIPISFNIPGEDVPNIKPASPLPVITRPVSIDGTTQPVKGQVQIYSQISEGEADGLRIEGGGSYIAGLMIYGFPRSAVALVAKGGNVIEKCILGGMDSLHGLLIDQSPGNTLKRTDCQDADSHGVKITGQTSTGNIISDSRLVNNGGCGVSIEDKAARTEIRKNEIGDNGADGIRVDFTGDGETVIIGNTIGAYEGTDIPNKGNGIAIRNAVKNRIGDGTVAGSGNIISANAQNGILLENTADNTVEGNTIGLSADGTKALPNGEHGICIRGAWNNTVGGSAANARNIISGNGKSGVYIETSVGRAGVPAQDNLIQGNTIGPDPAGQAAFPNGECGVFIGNSPSNLIQNNVISGNTTDGVCISGSGAVENIVELNMIGITEGNQPLGNKNNGVRLTQNCSLNTLLNNVISANLFAGVEISSAFSNFIQNNMIGTDKLGKDAMGNQADGIVLQSTAHGNLVGGSTLEQGNIIAANEGNGVSIKLESYENRVSANFIGTDLTGEIPLGNKGAGVFIEDSRANTIGGPERAYRNIISGNAFAGVVIIGSQPSPALGARNNGVSNNLIGTDVFGKAGIGNGTDGNELSAGVLIHQNASENVVEKNVIAATKESGVCIKGLIEQGHQPAGNIVRGNLIGIAEDETKMENQGHGVHIENASGSLIEANTIAFNTGSGIFAASGRGNRFSRNNIIDNWGMGIDLLPGEKATENDPGDPDTGANDLQNFPVLISATASRSGNLSVTGTFNSLPSTRHILEFFVSLGADPTGYGEGEKYVGFKEITTGADGNADFTAELPDAGAESEDVITATATAFLTEDGKTVSNTSEFSKGMTAVGPQILPGDVNGDGEITLADVIAALQVSVGMKDVQAFKEADVDGDGKIAFAEAAYAIGKVLGLRQ